VAADGAFLCDPHTDDRGARGAAGRGHAAPLAGGLTTPPPHGSGALARSRPACCRGVGALTGHARRGAQLAGGTRAQYRPVNHRSAGGVSSMREDAPTPLRLGGVSAHLVSTPAVPALLDALRGSRAVAGRLELRVRPVHALLGPRRADAPHNATPGTFVLALHFRGVELFRSEPAEARPDPSRDGEPGKNNPRAGCPLRAACAA
jgi:hypothetical protein